MKSVNVVGRWLNTTPPLCNNTESFTNIITLKLKSFGGYCTNKKIDQSLTYYD